IGTKHRGLSPQMRAAPHKLTPMLGVLRHGAADQAALPWKVLLPRPGQRVVICSKTVGFQPQRQAVE
ncbi:MAG: hypothetical protein KDB03_18855, partial [Planctomycetales bacterium]|nr:hypothetical protein [Planctomycetales bacterium]